LRASSPIALALAVAFTLLGAGCSSRTVVLVDPPSPTGLLDDIVGYWRLDDAPGSARARDSSGWGNDGMLVGLAPASVWVSGGRDGGALSVQGNGSVEVASSASIESIDTEVTVAAWVFLEGTIDEFGTAISRQVGTTYEQYYHLSISSISAQDRPALYITTSQKVYLQGPAAVPRGTWVHIAGTYDGATARLYLDGVQVASAAQSGTFPADHNPVLLSGNIDAASDRAEAFPGRLDEVMLYHRALGADEIARLYGGALFQ
jgi:hypothetical protein